MTPLLSPGKTWEGAAGGTLTACVTSWACFHWLAPWLVGSRYVEPPVYASLLYGLILAAAGMHGDLAESLLKRDMNRKDSSTWLPGLGGVLDIIDSVLVAAPCAYLCWVLRYRRTWMIGASTSRFQVQSFKLRLLRRTLNIEHLNLEP